MKKCKYILLFILSIGLLNSCVEDETNYDLNADGYNLGSFTVNSATLRAVADGTERQFDIKVKLSGPTVDKLTNDITLNFAIDQAAMVEAALADTTLIPAVENVHYKFTENTITLKKQDNYLGLIHMTVLTEGNEPAAEGQPAHKIPNVVLNVTSATGDANVVNNGKPMAINIEYTFFCPFAGVYNDELRYFHPSMGTYPDNLYGGVRLSQKELIPLSATKSWVYFGVWEDNKTIIQIDESNNMTVSFDKANAVLGVTQDPSLECSYDPITGIIMLYYHYAGAGGDRIFHEKLIPTF